MHYYNYYLWDDNNDDENLTIEQENTESYIKKQYYKGHNDEENFITYTFSCHSN